MMYATLAVQAALVAAIMLFSGATPATPAPAGPPPILQTASATPAKAALRCRVYFGCAPGAPALSAQN